MRPKNYCLTCCKEWYPRGSDRADKCPRCTSTAVGILGDPVNNQTPAPKTDKSAVLGCFVVLVILGLVGMVISPKDRKDAPTQPETKKEPAGKSEKPVKTAAVDPAPKAKPLAQPVEPPARQEATSRPAAATKAPTEIAPPPREYRWKLPLPSYSSAWQKFGAIELRIAGLSIAKVPLMDAKGSVAESEFPFLAIFVEVRKNAPEKKRTLLSWTVPGHYYGRIFDTASNELLPAKLPLGKKLHSGLPASQPLPDDGATVYDILLFAKPDESKGQLDLRLDAERCGESGDIWFPIPPEAWKKKLN